MTEKKRKVGRPRKVTPAEEKEIYHAFNAGELINDLAKEFKVSRSTINFIRKKGIKMRW